MINTPLQRIKNAIRFVNENGSNVWAILGQTSAWTGSGPNGTTYSDTNPPPESPTATSVNQECCAVQATAQWAQVNSEGAYQFKNAQGTYVNYSTIATEAEAIAAGCTLVLLTATATSDELATLTDINSFRQVGFATDLIADSGYTSSSFLLASQISYWGDCETLQNRAPVTINPGSDYSVSALLQF